MSKMTDLARTYRLPTKTTEEDLPYGQNQKVLRFGNRILVARYYYQPDGESWIAAVYEFLDDNETSCEDFIGLRWVGEERFKDDGHAIAWAMQNV